MWGWLGTDLVSKTIVLCRAIFFNPSVKINRAKFLIFAQKQK